jgi:DeoR family transcriptional regulator of aga operon
VPRAVPHEERPFEEARAAFAAEKAAIARAVVDRLSDRESIILDVGSTTAAVARELVARPAPREMVVFTNSLATALELEPAIPRHSVVVLGGTLRGLQHSLVDPMSAPMLEQLNVDTVVLGCNGVDAEAGMTNVNLPEAEVKRRMVRVAGRRIVVADGSKLGRVELVRFADVDEIDMVITGESADDDVVEALKAAGVDVVVAD